MTNANKKGWAARWVAVASIALTLGLFDARQSFAGCGGYCEARQALAICHQAVGDKDLKTRQRESEFEKCKADPASYLQFEHVTGGAGMTFE